MLRSGKHTLFIHMLIACSYQFRKLYEKLDYSIADIEASVGGNIALSSGVSYSFHWLIYMDLSVTDKVEVLMGRMRLPSLSLHGIEGAFYGPGAKTVIPAKVSGKFSIRYSFSSYTSINIHPSRTDWSHPKLPLTSSHL